ncbi:MAG: hypothetical protein QM699_02965 [Amaricoccus sp.]|uniref:hypothetical protein n=1 Tax=Amaricoccus sp. TaxID=1872485 RepID=UPI0039E5BCAA
MRCFAFPLVALAPLLVAGCAGQPAPQGAAPAPLPEATKQRMEAACGLAVAAHIDAPVSDVLPVWSGATPDDRGLVTVGDKVTGQQRIHFCEVSATGQVYAIRHNL